MTSSLDRGGALLGLRGPRGAVGATMFPVRPLLFAGTRSRSERWLPRLASEEGCLAAIAFTEPGAGSDVSGIQATARREGDEYVLNGEKCYVTNGGIAELTVVFAKLDGAITAFLLEAGDPGVSHRPEGAEARPPGLVHRLDPAGRRAHPGRPAPRRGGRGPRDRARLLQASRPQVAASAVGIARAAFEYATDYANERARLRQAADGQAGRLVQARRHGDGDRGGAAARLACGRGPRPGEDAGLLGSYAKAFAADAAMRATTEAVQVLGGAGIMRDHPVEKWFRDAKVLQIVEGTSEIQRHVIVQYLRRSNTKLTEPRIPASRPGTLGNVGAMSTQSLETAARSSPARVVARWILISARCSSCSPPCSGSRSRARPPASRRASRSPASTSGPDARRGADVAREAVRRVAHVPVVFTAGDDHYPIKASTLGVEADWDAALGAAAREGEGFGPVAASAACTPAFSERRSLRRSRPTPPHSTTSSAGSPPPSTAVTSRRSWCGAALRWRSCPSSAAAARPRPRRRDDRPDARAARTWRACRCRLRSTPSTVTAAELTPALRQARTALSAPVRLAYEGTRWKLPRWRIAELMSLPAAAGRRSRSPAPRPRTGSRGSARRRPSACQRGFRPSTPASASFRRRPASRSTSPRPRGAARRRGLPDRPGGAPRGRAPRSPTARLPRPQAMGISGVVGLPHHPTAARQTGSRTSQLGVNLVTVR